MLIWMSHYRVSGSRADKDCHHKGISDKGCAIRRRDDMGKSNENQKCKKQKHEKKMKLMRKPIWWVELLVAALVRF